MKDYPGKGGGIEPNADDYDQGKVHEQRYSDPRDDARKETSAESFGHPKRHSESNEEEGEAEDLKQNS